MQMRVEIGILCAFCVLLVLAPVAAMASASVSMCPITTVADPGDTFTVFIYSDDDSVLFNGYETVVRFDSTALAFVSATEGSVMISACYNRFWRVTPGPDSIFVGHGLLCPNTTATGPGPLCSMTFEALTDSRTFISSDYFWYTRAGIYIKDVIWHDGLVLVGSPAGTEVERRSERSSVCVRPNPGTRFDICLPEAIVDSDAQGIRLKVCDVTGRMVKDLGHGLPGAARSRVHWDGNDEAGRPVPSGIYFIVFSGHSFEETGKVVLVR
jgi:hypothetical protein